MLPLVIMLNDLIVYRNVCTDYVGKVVFFNLTAWVIGHLAAKVYPKKSYAVVYLYLDLHVIYESVEMKCVCAGVGD
jgi:hypothetical protein